MTRIEGKKKLQERLDTTGFGRLTKELYHVFEVCDSSFIPNIFLVEPFGDYHSLQQVEVGSLYDKTKLRKTKRDDRIYPEGRSTQGKAGTRPKRKR